MASASTMIPHGRSPRRPPPPPPPRSSKPKKPSPSRRAAPPPPPPPKRSSLPKSPVSGDKRSATAMESRTSKALSKPSVVPSWVALRDVEAFEKREEVGKGTYGIVFVARDKKNDAIMALKQVNTKQEENGFPMTALREVKILKALSHENIVTLKEMVTSKGMCASYILSSVRPNLPHCVAKCVCLLICCKHGFLTRFGWANRRKWRCPQERLHGV